MPTEPTPPPIVTFLHLLGLWLPHDASREISLFAANLETNPPPGWPTGPRGQERLAALVAFLRAASELAQTHTVRAKNDRMAHPDAPQRVVAFVRALTPDDLDALQKGARGYQVAATLSPSREEAEKTRRHASLFEAVLDWIATGVTERP